MRIMALEAALPITQAVVQQNQEGLAAVRQEMVVHRDVMKALDVLQDQHRLVTIDDTMAVLEQIRNIKECHCGDSVLGSAEDPIEVEDSDAEETAASEPESQVDFRCLLGPSPEDRIAMGIEEDDQVRTLFIRGLPRANPVLDPGLHHESQCSGDTFSVVVLRGSARREQSSVAGTSWSMFASWEEGWS
jgi:hypothetical protein